MNKTLISFVIGIAALTSSGFAQDDKDYQAWMKTTGAANGALRKNIEGKMGDQVSTDADKLVEVFKQVAAFWEKRGAADAVESAKKAESAAGQISAAAKAGNWDQASAGMATLSSTCGGCHMAHRERGQDGFKIK